MSQTEIIKAIEAIYNHRNAKTTRKYIGLTVSKAATE